MNEQTVKQGYFDRLQVSQNETNTAKPSLYNNIKHRFGLPTLSAIFVSALERRQSHERVASGSTFKPPPRVTLTEAKRKAWLLDLANPIVPLRKLSRTIPQGIRGQHLLDQCLVNSVPISRAIWFAKCVGANEIRTLKRKGTMNTFAAGPDCKWLKDWTYSVQQFVESIADQCGIRGWRFNVTYVLRLVARLYSETLLDRDHYLDWIVMSACAASLERLPFWLMLIHIHDKDLQRFRKRGKQLAEALLKKLKSAQDVNSEEMSHIVQELTTFIRKFMLSQPACFLFPQKWGHFDALVSICLSQISASDARLQDHLRRRNLRVSGEQPETIASPLSVRQSIIHILDSVIAPFNIAQLSQNCEESCQDRALLTTTVLDWGSTSFRFHESCLYLAVRLLRHWHRLGWDIDSPVLQHLSHGPDRLTRIDSLHHIVTELARSRSFSISRYLQSLTARGALRKHCFREGPSLFGTLARGKNATIRVQVCDDDRQLLTAIPSMYVDTHVRSLRTAMLSRAGFSIERERIIIELCKYSMSQHLADLSSPPRLLEHDSGRPLPDFSQLSWSIKSEIGQWLREVLQSPSRRRSDLNATKATNVARIPAPSLDQFNLVRRILEEIGDLSMLADVLTIYLKSDNELVLASIADTVCSHFGTFSALGALNELHRMLFESYISMRGCGISASTFTTSLIDLAACLPSELVSPMALQQDLARGDRSSTTAAFSPFSDGMAETLQQAESTTFIEDFEALLLTGNSMDEHTMNQLFVVLVERLEKAIFTPSLDEDPFALCQLLARLRIFQAAQFELLAGTWVMQLLSNPNVSHLEHLFLLLVGTGCISLEALFTVSKKVLRTNPSALDQPRLQQRREVIAKLIDMDGKSASASRIAMRYRFIMQRDRYTFDHPLDMLDLLADIASNDSDTRNDVSSSHAWLSSLLRGMYRLKHKSLPAIGDVAKGLLASALDMGLQTRITAPSLCSNIPSLLDVANDFSIGLCSLRLQLLSSSSDSRIREAIGEALYQCAVSDKQTSCCDSNHWPMLFSVLDADAARRVREKAEEAFFVITPTFGGVRPGVSSLMVMSHADLQMASKLLDIVGKTSHTISSGIPNIASRLIDRFGAILRYLGGTPTSALIPASVMPSAEISSILVAYLPLLLRMTCLHRSAFSPTTVSISASPPAPNSAMNKQIQQEQVKILVLLSSIALQPALAAAPYKNIVSHVLDVAASLVDEVADDMRTLCCRVLKDKMRDPRMHFLFGRMNVVVEIGSPGNGLQIVRDGKGVVGEWRIKQWELLEGGAEASLSLSLFQSRSRRAG